MRFDHMTLHRTTDWPIRLLECIYKALRSPLPVFHSYKYLCCNYTNRACVSSLEQSKGRKKYWSWRDVLTGTSREVLYPVLLIVLDLYLRCLPYTRLGNILFSCPVTPYVIGRAFVQENEVSCILGHIVCSNLTDTLCYNCLGPNTLIHFSVSVINPH